MSDSILQVNKIQDKTGNADGITIANTSANVTIGNLTATSLAGGNITSAVTGFAGIKEIDSWRITSNLTTNANGVFPATANWERDDTGQASQLLGTGMTQSSGVFTFFISPHSSLSSTNSPSIFLGLQNGTLDS